MRLKHEPQACHFTLFRRV
ncbi:hypothetical protein D027_2376A, partial [Vibrio parahaemolyticus 861]